MNTKGMFTKLVASGQKIISRPTDLRQIQCHNLVKPQWPQPPYQSINKKLFGILGKGGGGGTETGNMQQKIIHSGYKLSFPIPSMTSGKYYTKTF